MSKSDYAPRWERQPGRYRLLVSYSENSIFKFDKFSPYNRPAERWFDRNGALNKLRAVSFGMNKDYKIS